ncbi:histidine kinase dimerization/phospho-acceptor domain-containing protein [Kiritimatiella glycovorans]|uniref:histidine kinase n=1 Tax=Kiritimatiella glycovorans TaxID=1307763 RepID=A0A0G3EB81_9BACT|nr:histidine kinase dimerization/phospho-acceptor domain-containing protein [Kiritimatiella glycovorans]AKJ63548.1 Two component sensor [Kiritimatiella glycovorans]
MTPRKLLFSLSAPTSWPELVLILLLRLAALCGFLIMLSLILPGDNIAFYAFMGFAFIITIPYSLWLRNQEHALRFAPLQFLVDITLVSGLVYFTGGIESELNMLYPLVILSAGVVSTPRRALQITLLSILVYILLIVLMTHGVLVPPGGVPPGYELASVAPSLTLRVFVFLFFGIASAYVSERCNYITRKKRQFRQLTELIFRHVRAGLLLLDEKDRVLLANGRAAELLGTPPRDLQGRNLSDLQRPVPKDRTISISPAVYMERPDGTAFPATYETSSLELPAEAVPGVRLHSEPLHGQLMIFNDISRLIEMQDKAQQVERMRAAADMAADVAHEIRTPLTAISGAVQILNRMDKETFDPLNDSAREEKELLEQIFSQSAKIDSIIQRFLDYAEFSRDDLQRILELDLDVKSS